VKIECIEVYQLDLPYSGGTYHLSGGRTYTSFDATFARVVTDNGIEGWGESTPFGATYIAAHALGTRAGIAEIAPSLIGQDPRAVDRINDRMDATLVGHNHAKTPLDVACWDIFGKSVGLPVYQLLGGSTGEIMPVISSIHAGTPDDMRQRVADHRARGYRGHSIKIGAADPALDAERIEACLADRQPGEFFQADANGGMLVEQVLRLLNLLPDKVDIVLEAPCASWRETLSLRKRCRLPIMMDELAQQDQDVAQIIAQDLADGIGLKVSKAGGLTPGRRQRDMCRAAGLTMSVQDTVGSTIAFAALAHLGQTVPAKNLRCILDCRDMVSIETAQFDAPIKDGGVVVPDLPGLGIEVDRDLLGTPVQTFS
jgi:L-alanine-DL-glutamate epimerase-like enolase superfamily enzyme